MRELILCQKEDFATSTNSCQDLEYLNQVKNGKVPMLEVSYTAWIYACSNSSPVVLVLRDLHSQFKKNHWRRVFCRTFLLTPILYEGLW